MSTENERVGGVTREEWKETEVAKASTISCQFCGMGFPTPHDFYDHLDEVHPKDRHGKRR